MPAPADITYASRAYEAFAADLKATALLETHNQVYAMTRAVLHQCRSHLAVEEGLAFAQGLPAVLRAIFVEGWHGSEVPQPFADPDAFLADVVTRLAPHHVPPASIVRDVAVVLGRHADPKAWSRALDALPPGLAGLWRG